MVEDATYLEIEENVYDAALTESGLDNSELAMKPQNDKGMTGMRLYFGSDNNMRHLNGASIPGLTNPEEEKDGKNPLQHDVSKNVDFLYSREDLMKMN